MSVPDKVLSVISTIFMIAGFNLLTMQYIYKNIGEYFIQVLNFRIYAKHGYLLFCFGFDLFLISVNFPTYVIAIIITMQILWKILKIKNGVELKENNKVEE